MLQVFKLFPSLLCLLLIGCATHSGPAGKSARFITPLESKAYSELTTHEELVAFVTELSEASDRLTLYTLGESVEGRTIPYLKISDGVFGENRDEKLLLLIFAQQHGNEPSGKEGALVLARNFAEGRYDDLLASVDVLLVPQVNPDGRERHQRRNADNVDLNRSHLILDGKEVRHLRELFHRWEPEVTLDVHEYQPWTNAWLRHGFIRLFDEQYGIPTNVNVPAPIRELAENDFLPYAADYLKQRGFSFHNYTVGNPDAIRYSTSNINDGRQGFAILSSFGLILEGKNGRTPTDNIEQRTAAQAAAMEALVEFSAKHGDEIRQRVEAARQNLTNGRVTHFTLTMVRESDGNPLRIPARAVEDAPEGHDDRFIKAGIIEAEIENYFPLVVAEEKTPLPHAYLVPATEHQLIELLRQHRVEMEELNEGQTFLVEAFTIEGFEEREYESVTRVPVGSTQQVLYPAASGDVLIPTAQLRGLLVATALEARSMHGLIHYEEFEHLNATGVYPVKRVLTRGR